MYCYNIVDKYNICGKIMECLCDTPTKVGSFMVTFDESQAIQRVKELHDMGHTDARYEKVLSDSCWWNDKTWF